MVFYPKLFDCTKNGQSEWWKRSVHTMRTMASFVAYFLFIYNVSCEFCFGYPDL